MEFRETADILGNEDLYRRDLLAFYVNVSCLLNSMAKNALEMKPRLKGRANIAEAVFNAGEYQIRVICRNKGVKPFLAYMDAPFKHTAYLGRLTKEGKVHMFAHGVKVFFDQLLEEEVCHAFRRDLENALDAFLAPRAPECAKDCLSACKSVPGEREPEAPTDKLN